MLITIVTVSYNAASVIEETIKSVLNQSYKYIEYIIIDGGSTDGTIDIIKKYADNLSCWISEPDKGIYDAMNKGINKANGKWINFMNAGDSFIDNNVIEKVALSINSNYGVTFGDTIINKNGQRIIHKANPFYNKKKLHHKMGFNHQSTFVRTDLAKKYLFDLNYKLAADYNMIISLYRTGIKFKQLDFTIALYDLNGISNQKTFEHALETLTIDNRFPSLINFILAKTIAIKVKITKLFK